MLDLNTMAKQKWVAWFLFFSVIGFGFLLKRPCLIQNWGGAAKVEYTSYCYNDIQALYGIRGLSDRKIPYFEVLPYEYPPLIAGQMYLTSLLSRNHAEFFIANWVVNVLCLALSLLLLLKLAKQPERVLYFCVSSCLFLYAGMNWDATSVLLLILVLHSTEKKQYFLAGVFGGLSLGGKLFPVFCFLPLATENFKNKERLQKLVVGGVVGAGILYLPLFLFSLWKQGNLDPILSIFLFHAKRLPEYDTIWHWTSGIFGYSPYDDKYRIFVERISFLILILGATFTCYWNRKKNIPWRVSGAIIVLLLLVSKIYSPQYSLWLLPFFVLNPLPAKWIYAFYLADLWGFFARFSWYPVMGTQDEFFWKNQLMWAVFFRSFVMLVVMYYWAIRTKNEVIRR